MKLNSKGDIGFPEAIMAVMIVTIVLTAYLGAFVMNVHGEQISNVNTDEALLSTFHIENDDVVGDAEKDLTAFIERNGYRGAMIRCSVPGDLVNGDLLFTVGNMDGTIVGDKYLKTLNSDNGTAIPVVFEVAICY